MTPTMPVAGNAYLRITEGNALPENPAPRISGRDVGRQVRTALVRIDSVTHLFIDLLKGSSRIRRNEQIHQ